MKPEASPGSLRASTRRKLPFVGRERELEFLKERLSAATEGEAGVVLISGEPGVGKTRLLTEFADHAAAKGWQVLIGQAYDSEGMPPYLPFIEALEAYAWACSFEELRTQLGEGAEHLALILPAIGRRLDDLPVSKPFDVDSARYRLFDSVSEFTGAIARASRPGLLLCLEDLQWADDATLRLLEHVCRRLQKAPVLLLATYRDTDLDVSRPLARTLEQFARQEKAQRVDVKRLDIEGVGLMLADLGRPDPPTSLVGAVYAEAEGNPFFVREVFEHLAEEGRLFDAAGAWRNDLQVGTVDVPQGVRLVIGRRLERLSSDCRNVLSLAAVLGRTLDYQLLQALSDMGDEALLVALEEAEAARLLVSNDRGTLTFSHELIRQALLAGLTALRRQRLHLRAAQAIETIHGDLIQSHAGELASHYRLAGTIADPEKAVFYAERAAEASRAVFAWEEASSHYQWALQSFELAGFEDNHRRCDLLLALGEVLVAGGDRGKAREVALQALAVAEGIDDHSRAFAACRLGFDAAGGPSPQYWLEQAERHVGENIEARIELNGYKSVRAVHDGRFQETRALLLEALGLARGMDDPSLGLDIASRLMRYGNLSADEERQVFDETRALARGSSRTRDRGSTSLDAVMTHLQWGEREEAQLERQGLIRLATETRYQTTVIHAAAADALFATLDGRLSEALNTIVAEGVGTFPRLWRARLANWLADSAALQAELDWARTFDSYLRPAYEAYFLAQAGRVDDAREVLSGMAELNSRARQHIMTNTLASILLEAAVLSSHRKAASMLLDFFSGDHRQLVTPNFVFVPRHLAGAASLLGDFERAKATYYEAIAFCERIGFRPELALTRLELAELLLRQFPDQRVIALAHLNFAMTELKAMGMEPALQRALRLGGRKRPSRESSSTTYPDGLSKREVEVLRLITAGKRNGQIADELFISPNTVTHHVSNIFNKTQSANRTEAAAYAHRLGLA